MIRITSRENPQVKRAFSLTGSKSVRAREGEFICQGFTMLVEAITAAAEITAVFCLEAKAAQLPKGIKAPVYLVNDGILEKISGVQSPQGVVFTCKIPQQRLALTGSRFLALEDIRDPGNLGTIIRSAEALGAHGIYLLGDCAELWSPKTVRATMGSVFRMPIMSCTPQHLVSLLGDLPLWAAALDKDSMAVQSVDISRGCVVIGNEARGVSPDTKALCKGSIIVPITGAESLNAAMAAGIILWEMVRGDR